MFHCAIKIDYKPYWIILLIMSNWNLSLAQVASKPTYKKDSLSQPVKMKNKMIAVIFEVMPADGRKQEYLDIAKSLRPHLDSIDGFISIERFESIYTPGKILSLSFWRDEESVKQWRNTEDHRLAQDQGRNGVFKDYRLRVATIIRDYGMFDRAEVPTDSKDRYDKIKN
jgi:heme-degrading monooxygenase HmoA